MSQKIRMKNPEDTFMKRQFMYIGKPAHKFYQLPGKFLGCDNVEYPDVGGGIPRADVVYKVEMEDKSVQIINIEDETSRVNEDTLRKSHKYKTNITYRCKKPVISVITTTVPIEKCLKELKFSQTDIFRPLIKSLPYKGSWKRLNILINKANNQEEFSDEEAVELINLPRFCLDNQDIAVEKICNVLFNLKVADAYIKNELIYSMQCMIHKYAKTEKDIIRLEGLIGLKSISEKRSQVLDNMERQGFLKGRTQGITLGKIEGRTEGRTEGISEGKLDILNAWANDSNSNVTVEELAERFGFTVDEILNGNR